MVNTINIPIDKVTFDVYVFCWNYLFENIKLTERSKWMNTLDSLGLT